jgi:hypothetical protein
MMSVGLHGRISGHPGRAIALARFLDYVQGHNADSSRLADPWPVGVGDHRAMNIRKAFAGIDWMRWANRGAQLGFVLAAIAGYYGCQP